MDNEGYRENSSITISNGVYPKKQFVRLHPKTLEFDYIKHTGKLHELEIQRQIYMRENILLLQKREQIKKKLSQTIKNNELLETPIREKDQHAKYETTQVDSCCTLRMDFH